MHFVLDHLASSHQLFRFSVVAVQVYKVQCFGGTDRNACGFEPLLQAMLAEGALVGITLGMDVSRVIRTGGDTGLAARAEIRFDLNRSVSPVMGSSRWTVADAGSIFTMLTTFRTIDHGQLRVISLDALDNPVPAETFRYVVFRFTSIDTGGTAYTPFGVNDHRVFALACHGSYALRVKVTKLFCMPVPPMIGSMSKLVIRSASLAPRPKACSNSGWVWPKP